MTTRRKAWLLVLSCGNQLLLDFLDNHPQERAKELRRGRRKKQFQCAPNLATISTTPGDVDCFPLTSCISVQALIRVA